MSKNSSTNASLLTDGGKMFSPKQKASDLVPPASKQILALKQTSPTHTYA